MCFKLIKFHTLIICRFLYIKKEKISRLFIENNILSSLNYLCKFVKDHFLIYLSVYLWNLYSVLWSIFFPTFKTSTRYLWYWCFIIPWNNIVLILQVKKKCFDYSRFSAFLNTLQNKSFDFFHRACQNFDWYCVESIHQFVGINKES